MKREELIKYLEWSCDTSPLPDYLIKDIDDFIATYPNEMGNIEKQTDEEFAKMKDGSFVQIGCIDVKRDLWANINCQNHIDPATCNREVSCLKCDKYKIITQETNGLYRIKKERVHEVISQLKAKLNSNLDFTKESFCNNLDTFRDEILSLPILCQPKDGLTYDLKQYMTNLLYAAYDKGKEPISPIAFDLDVEEWVNGIDLYFKQ